MSESNEQSPLSRRERRLRSEDPGAPASPTTQAVAAPDLQELFADDKRTHKRKPKRNTNKLGCLISAIIVLAVVGAIAWGTTYVVQNFGSQISSLFGENELDDFEEGEATGEASVTISTGDTGTEISNSLYEAGVTKTPDVFYEMLIDTGQNPTFFPGVYQLQQRMTSHAALDTLESEDSRIDNAVLIREGEYKTTVLDTLATALEVPIEEVEAEADNFTQFGIPDSAGGIEGYLFPATYEFEPGTTPRDALQRIVDEGISRLDALGVAEADREQVLIEASLVQREARTAEDMRMVARVFLNRIDEGMPLQSDATVTYGTGNTHTVWTSDEERADASNPYNTYVHTGWMPGPIGNPGVEAIEAVLEPAGGAWLYFVTVNLATGETRFSNTFAEHEVAVAQLQAWCAESEENASYCA